MEQIIYNILSSLQKSNNHIRGVALELGINHMSISRYLSFLQKENVVDYEVQGKNNVFFIKKSLEANEYLNMLEHNKLIQLIKQPVRLRHIVSEIKKLNISLVILFGSYAKGSFTSKSDIDIYIDTTDSKIKKRVELIDSKISVKLGVFDRENLLIKEIIKNHIIIDGVDIYGKLIS